MTDPLGNKTSYSYDTTHHNLTTITPPSPLGATSVVVDTSSGLVNSVTDAKAQKTSYAYDAEGRITQLLFAGTVTCGSTNCITYSYDSDGNLTQRVDSTGTTTFSYDALSRVTDKGTPSGADGCSGSSPAGLTYTYDAATNLTSACDANGATTYRYDTANRLVSMAEATGSCTGTVSLCTTFAYNNANERTTTTFPGGATETASYIPSGPVSSIVGKSSTSASITSLAYTYNAGSTDTSLVQTRVESDPLASNTYGYTYDAFNRLTAATITAGTGTSYSYAYDANGNRCANAASCASPTFTYNAANELTTGPRGSYAYDANGNETVSPQQSNLSYNAVNQTSSVTPRGGSVLSMSYADADSTERTAAGTTSLVSGAFGIDRATTSGVSSFYLRDASGNLVGELVSGVHYYFLHDNLGSVVAVINGSGTIADRFAYDPYGTQTTATGTVADPFQFAGGYRDTTTGLTKFGTRYYDPTTGRWTQQDPIGGSIGNPQTVDRYVYAGDGPVSFVDPAGTSFFGAIVNAISSFSGVVIRSFGGQCAFRFVVIGFIIFIGVVGAPFTIGATLAVAIGFATTVGLPLIQAQVCS